MKPTNYSPTARPEYAGLRSADHDKRIEGTRNARAFASPTDEVPVTGAEMLRRAGVKAAPKVKQ